MQEKTIKEYLTEKNITQAIQSGDLKTCVSVKDINITMHEKEEAQAGENSESGDAGQSKDGKEEGKV